MRTQDRAYAFVEKKQVQYIYMYDIFTHTCTYETHTPRICKKRTQVPCIHTCHISHKKKQVNFLFILAEQ